MSNRRVVCAANRFVETFYLDGTEFHHTPVIVLGARHFDNLMHEDIRRTYFNTTEPEYSDWEQGFIDQRGEFLTREEAWLVAQEAGQIIRRVGGDYNNETNVGKLFSENLY